MALQRGFSCTWSQPLLFHPFLPGGSTEVTATSRSTYGNRMLPAEAVPWCHVSKPHLALIADLLSINTSQPFSWEVKAPSPQRARPPQGTKLSGKHPVPPLTPPGGFWP